STGARASELVRLNIENIQEVPEGLLVEMYRSKTRRFDDVPIPREDSPVTITAATRWISFLAETGRTTGPLFLRIAKGGQLAPIMYRGGAVIGDRDGRLTDQVVGDVLKKYGVTVDPHGNWTGHGLRRGMATTAARAGHSRGVIARQGGWDPNS